MIRAAGRIDDDKGSRAYWLEVGTAVDVELGCEGNRVHILLGIIADRYLVFLGDGAGEPGIFYLQPDVLTHQKLVKVPVEPGGIEGIALIKPRLTIILLLDSGPGEGVEGFLHCYRIGGGFYRKLLAVGFRDIDALQAATGIDEAEGTAVFCFRGWQGIEGVTANSLRTFLCDFLFGRGRSGECSAGCQYL